MNEHLFPYIDERLASMLVKSKGYEGEPEYPYPSKELIWAVKTLTPVYLPDYSPTPSVIPDEEWTGIMFVWHKNGYDISLYFNSEFEVHLWWRLRSEDGFGYELSDADEIKLQLRKLMWWISNER